jgi:hypothetical protein
MIDIDRAVLQNIMLVVPFADWSPLFTSREGQERFVHWCASDPEAARLVRDALAEAPVFELDSDENAFVLSVDYADAEVLVRNLMTRYEDAALERLFNDYY